MSEEDLYKLIDFVEEIKKINEVISLHNTMEGAGFMVEQYKAK